MKKIIVVGGVAGGASFAARARRLDEFAKITMYEKGPDVSFSNCSLPFYLSGIVKDEKDLVMMNPYSFKKIYNIDVEVNHEVISIDKERKVVRVKNLITQEIIEDPYDVLVLSPGASPVMPQSIEGIQSPHVFSVRNVQDIVGIKNYIETHNVEDVAVIGAGFIGLEVAENLRLAGKNVSIVEAASQALLPMDEDMVQIVHKELFDQGVHLFLNDGLSKIEKDEVILASGKHVPAKVVIMAIGVRPEIRLAQEAGLKIGDLGAISVNHHYQTSDPNIYALGDAIEETHRMTLKNVRLTMAGPAQRQAKRAADHVYGRTTRNKGVIGASILKVFNQNVAFTGLNEKNLDALGIDYRSAYVIPEDKVGIMPDSAMMHFKLLFSYPSGKVLGAQAIGVGNVDKRIDIISTAIAFGAHVEDLQDLELSYSPSFNNPKDVVNHASSVAVNILNDEVSVISLKETRNLIASGAFLIDTREMPAYQMGTVQGSKHIPMSQFRERLDEIPKDRPVYIFCQTGVRSYNMSRALKQLGFDNIVNISGSFLGIYHYEYFNIVQGLKPSIFA